MTKEERQNLVEKLGESLLEFEIDAEIKIYRECAYYMKDSNMKDSLEIAVDKKLEPENKEKVEKFNEKVKDFT